MVRECQEYTPVEAALQREFVFGKKTKCVISYPMQQMDYVSSWCKSLGLVERPQFGEDEEVSQSTAVSDSDTTNSQDSD